jgi:hypothetical protein
MFFDLTTRELLRTRPNPLTPTQLHRVRGAGQAGRRHGPRPSQPGSSGARRTPE